MPTLYVYLLIRELSPHETQKNKAIIVVARSSAVAGSFLSKRIWGDWGDGIISERVFTTLIGQALPQHVEGNRILSVLSV